MKIVRWAAMLGVAALALWGLKWAAVSAYNTRFHQVPEKVALPRPATPAEAMHQDLQVLAQLTTLDRSFSPEALQRFDRERAQLDARVAKLSREEFEMQVSKLVAIAGNGHTSVVRRSRRLNQVPLRFAWFAEGLFVTRAKEPFAALLGDEVLAIDGHPVRQVSAALRPFLSGTSDWAQAVDPLMLQSPAALRGIGIAGDANMARYTLRKPSGETIAVGVPAEPAGSDKAYTDPARNYSPEAAPESPAAWRSALASANLPLVLRDPDASVYVQPLDGGKGLYVHMVDIMGDARGSLERQLANIVDAIEPGSLRYAILDLRLDGGGNYLETLAFTKELPRRVAPDGQVFILTDHATFSAAVVTLARAKYFAGSRGVILGEHAGDREQFWAESAALLELPNSKIFVNYATGYHDWANGCGFADLSRCFWLNFAYDVPAGSLAPAADIAWRFGDYTEGVDTVMREVERRIAHPPGP
jgi:hypothetical protein